MTIYQHTAFNPALPHLNMPRCNHIINNQCYESGPDGLLTDRLRVEDFVDVLQDLDAADPDSMDPAVLDLEDSGDGQGGQLPHFRTWLRDEDDEERERAETHLISLISVAKASTDRPIWLYQYEQLLEPMYDVDAICPVMYRYEWDTEGDGYTTRRILLDTAKDLSQELGVPLIPWVSPSMGGKYDGPDDPTFLQWMDEIMPQINGAILWYGNHVPSVREQVLIDRVMQAYA